MKIFIYPLLMMSLTAYAQSIQVQQLDEKFDAKELANKTGGGAEVKTLEALNKGQNTKELPSDHEVSVLLVKAGLEKEAKTFDSLDKDQLYLRAGYFDLNQLSKLYPKSSNENLKKLIELVSLQKKRGMKK